MKTLRAVEALLKPLEQLSHPSLTGFALAVPAVEGQTSVLVAEGQVSVPAAEERSFVQPLGAGIE